MGEGLLKADLSTRLHTLAVIYAEGNDRRQAAQLNNISDLTQLLEDLRVRLDDDYKFTKEQLVSPIRATSSELSYLFSPISAIFGHKLKTQSLKLPVPLL